MGDYSNKTIEELRTLQSIAQLQVDNAIIERNAISVTLEKKLQEANDIHINDIYNSGNDFYIVTFIGETHIKCRHIDTQFYDSDNYSIIDGIVVDDETFDISAIVNPNRFNKISKEDMVKHINNRISDLIEI